MLFVTFTVKNVPEMGLKKILELAPGAYFKFRKRRGGVYSRGGGALSRLKTENR